MVFKQFTIKIILTDSDKDQSFQWKISLKQGCKTMGNYISLSLCSVSTGVMKIAKPLNV